MTDYYVSASGSNTSPYDTWAKAANLYATITSLLDYGDVVHVDHTHQEDHSGGLDLYGSLSGNHTDEPLFIISQEYNTTNYAPGAVLNSTNDDVGINGNSMGVVIVGCEIVANDNIIAGADGFIMLEGCNVELTGGGAADLIRLGTQAARLVLRDTTLTFDHAGQAIQFTGAYALMIGVSLAGTAISNLIEQGGDGSTIDCYSSDFSNASYFSDDWDNVNPGGGVGRVNFYRCKLPAVEPISGSIPNLMTRTEAYGSDDGTLTHGLYIEDGLGTAQETTSIYLDATYDGTNEWAIQIADTAKTVPGLLPFRIPLAMIPVIADQTFTVELVEDSATPLTDAEVWLELVFPGSPGPQGRNLSSVNEHRGLAAGTNLDASSASWTGTGGFSNEDKRKVSITASAGLKGVHQLVLCVATGSVRNIWVNPLVDVS